MQAGYHTFGIYVADVSGNASTTPLSGFGCYTYLNGISNSTSVSISAASISGDKYTYNLGINLLKGDNEFRPYKAGWTITPNLFNVTCEANSVDTIMTRLTSGKSIPPSFGSVSTINYSLCGGYDDLVCYLPSPLVIPNNQALGGNGVDLTGWTATTYSATVPSISAGTLTITSPTAAQCTLSVLQNKLPYPGSSGYYGTWPIANPSFNYVIDLRFLSPTAEHTTPLRINVTMTQS